MRKVKLSEIYDGLFDGPHATPKPSDSGPIFLGIKNITTDGRLDLSSIRHISNEEFPKWTKRVTPKKGDIVFSYEATLHRYAIIPEGFIGCLGRRMALIRPNEEKINTEYLFNYFFTEQWRTEVRKYILTGSTVDRVPLTKVPEFEIVIHDRKKQDEIAGVITAYNNFIENNNRRIAILEDMAQSLYREWFVNFRFPGHKQCQFVDSELGRIPEGWEVKKVKDFGEVVTGKTPSKKKEEYYNNPDVPFIKTPDMHGGIYVLDTTEKLSFKGADSQKKKTIPVGSILVSCIGTAGVVAINANPAQTNQQINSVVLNNDYEREFLYFAICDLKQTIINYGSTGATMANLSKGKFESLKVLYPAKEKVKEFSAFVKPKFEMILNFMIKNNNLIKQRDNLLPKLISGKLKV